MDSRPSRITRRAAERSKTLRNEVLQRHPGLTPRHATADGTFLGHDERGDAVTIPPRTMLEHCLVVGATGGGKTKLLEHMIRQDALNGRGLCVLDPHGSHPGSLFKSVLSWLHQQGLTRSRTVHLIDPNVSTHVTGFDPLALPDPDYDPAVIADAVLEAIEKLWNEETGATKPTLQRVLSGVVTALCELGLTLAELEYLLDDPDDSNGVRAWMIGELQNPVARGELQWLDSIAKEPRGRSEFRLEVTGPRNRFSKITHLDSLRLMVGQQERVIDFRAVLDRGDIILVNLAPGPRLSDKAAQLLGRLLLRMVFFHAQRRACPDRPVALYADEAHLFVSGDVARLLAEIRKYGVSCIFSSQFLGQFEQVGLDLLQAIKSNTNTKIVFRSRDAEEAAELAEMVLPFDLEKPVEALIKPTTVGHRVRWMRSENESEQQSVTLSRGRTRGVSEGVSNARSHTDTASSELSVGQTFSSGFSASDGWNRSRASDAGVVSSRANTAGTGESQSQTDSYTPPPDRVFDNQPKLLGTALGKNTQTNNSTTMGISESAGRSEAAGRSGSLGMSWGLARSRGRSFGTSHATGETKTLSHTHNDSSSVSRGEGHATTRGGGWQESLEPVYQLLPGAVHGIENCRYAGAQFIRSLPTGHAVVSFVSADGLQTAAITVPHVENCALPSSDLETLRRQVLDASPSASRIEDARDHVSRRKKLLLEEARKALQSGGDAATAQIYRNKKKRPAKGTPRAGS
jgi:hypothetical protein